MYVFLLVTQVLMLYHDLSCIMRVFCRHVSRFTDHYGFNLSPELSKYDCVKSELCLTLYIASFRALQDEGVQTADSSYSDHETQCTVSESAEVTEHNLLS
jgi:hypothetical protein